MNSQHEEWKNGTNKSNNEHKIMHIELHDAANSIFENDRKVHQQPKNPFFNDYILQKESKSLCFTDVRCHYS